MLTELVRRILQGTRIQGRGGRQGREVQGTQSWDASQPYCHQMSDPSSNRQSLSIRLMLDPLTAASLGSSQHLPRKLKSQAPFSQIYQSTVWWEAPLEQNWYEYILMSDFNLLLLQLTDWGWLDLCKASLLCTLPILIVIALWRASLMIMAQCIQASRS